MLTILLASECEYKQMNINARSRLKHSATVILYAVLMAVIIIGIIAAWIIVSGRNRIAIDEVYGNVIVERSGGQISAKQGMRLESGDCVKVLSGGSARITLGRDRYIYPEADSAVTVTRSKEDKSFGAELLIQKEVIMAEDVEHIFGKRPWLSRSQEIMEDEQPKIDEAVKELPEVQAAIKEHEAAKKNAEDSEKETPANESNEENPNENNNGKNNE